MDGGVIVIWFYLSKL